MRITGVKQAIEVKQEIPDAEVYSFYMDMRMSAPVTRSSTVRRNSSTTSISSGAAIGGEPKSIDGRVQIKAEDTLIGLPLRMTVDMLVLIVGMKAGASNMSLSRCCGVALYPSGFVKPLDQFAGNVRSGSERIFYAGTVTAPKNIGESINEAVVGGPRGGRAIKE